MIKKMQTFDLEYVLNKIYRTFVPTVSVRFSYVRLGSEAPHLCISTVW